MGLNVRYVVPHPLTDAVRQRVLSVGTAMARTGLVDEVVVMSPMLDPPLDQRESRAVRWERSEDREGLEGRSKAWKALWRLAIGRDSVERLEGMKGSPDIVVVYGGGAMFVSRVTRWAKAHSAALVLDLVEWYDPNHQPLGRWGPFALDNELMMRRSPRYADGFIVISSFLERHVEPFTGGHILRVPPLASVISASEIAKSSDVGAVRLAYCGNPGRKDRLDLVLDAVKRLDPQGEALEFSVVGPTEDWTREYMNWPDIPRSIRVLGRRTSVECREIVARADFMPLIRDDSRLATAGFPTKVVEALAAGTPPLVNMTSDLNRFLRDGDNALIVPQATRKAVEETLLRSLDIGRVAHTAMRARALSTAQSHFSINESLVRRTRSWLYAVAAAVNGNGVE